MAKPRTIFICQQCGNQQSRWLGKCPDCGGWDTFAEQIVATSTAGGRKVTPVANTKPIPITQVEVEGFNRLPIQGEEFTRVLGGGLVPGSLVLIGGDPGIGKCLAGNERVLDPISGAYVPITEWADLLRPVLAIDDKTLRLSPQEVSTVHDQGIRSVVKVTTRLGRTLCCTPSHPVLTPEGWRAVGELLPGARIASPRSLPYFGQEVMDEPTVKLIAYILGDGSAQGSIDVTTALPEVVSDLEAMAKHFGMTLRAYHRENNKSSNYRFVLPIGQRAMAREEIAAAIEQVKQVSGIQWTDWARMVGVPLSKLRTWRDGAAAPSVDELQRLANAVNVPLDMLAPEARGQAEMTSPVARILQNVGLRYSRAETKAVPTCIFKLPKPQLATFLKVLFTCDGSVYVTNNDVPALSYTTISKRLAQDIQHLLLRFGFIVKLRTKRQKVNGEPYTAYELQMLGVAEVKRFLDEIGIMGREAAKAKIEQLAIPTLASTHFDTVPTGAKFWQELRVATNEAGWKDVSGRAGVTIRNRRPEGPLCRSTVSAIADAYPTPYLQALAHGDVYWDEIESVEEAGEEHVYDLTVPHGANFVASDLIVHNSTLLTAVAAQFAKNVAPALYVSAEESAQQLKMRTERLGMLTDQMYVVSETSLDSIIQAITDLKPGLVIVDSVQTVYVEEVSSAAGSVSQVREVALRLLRVAKDTNTPIFLVGHVTKEGTIAGPRVLEHIVDVVLYLEGDRFHQYRMLRGQKNRFGSTDEVGVFAMTQGGLEEVPNPSQVFLAERSAGTPGSTVAVTMEGTRPILVEVQALTAQTQNPQPRRTANGFDPNRLTMLIAVLAKRVGMPLFNQDIYVNVVGGLRITEPAADLAVATAIASSFRNQRVDPDLVLVGEIGLSGELRGIGQLERRLGEASKLGFKRALHPLSSGELRVAGLQLSGVRSVGDAIRTSLLGQPRADGEDDV